MSASDDYYDYEDSEDGLCHICERPLSNHKPRKGKIMEQRGEGRSRSATVSESKGIGICDVHGVSYDERSMPDVKCRTCNCGKEDCPTCSS